VRWRKSGFLLLTTLLAAWFVAACTPEKKKEGEACKTNFDCVEGLVCFAEKCQNAETKPEGKKPQALITGNLRVKVGERTALDGRRSLFYSPKPSPAYEWMLESKPDGSNASLSDSNADQVSISPDIAGSYKISLVAKDGSLESDRVEATIEAFKDNVPPEAKLTPEEATVKVGDKVEIDGSTSTDADGDTLTFAWSFRFRPDGSNATLADADKNKASFTPDKAGLYTVELRVSDGKGGQSLKLSYITATEEPPAPTLTALSPNSGIIGTTPEVDLQGTNFLFGVKVLLDGTPVAAANVEYFSNTRLRAKLPLTGRNAGTLKVKVENPDGKASGEQDFTVQEGQKPEITYVGPPLVIAGQIVDLNVQGSNFVPGGVVSFDGKDLETTYDSTTKLLAVLNVPADGEYDVIVKNPDGKNSDPYKFRVSSVSPIIDGISFRSIGKDCASETLVINGRNMLVGVEVALVNVDDPSKRIAPKNLTYISMTQLRAEFDFTLATEGAYKLAVKNVSSTTPAEVDFTITEMTPTPAILSVAPKQLFFGTKEAGYLVGLNLEGAKVELDGQTITLKRSNETLYELDVDTMALTQAKTLEVKATGLCNRQSNTQEVNAIDIPTPVIESITPQPVSPASPTITINGVGFHPSATVKVDGNAASDAVVINTQQITISGTAYTTLKEYKVIVENPGGKNSAEFPFVVDEFLKLSGVPANDDQHYIRACGTNIQNPGTSSAANNARIQLLNAGQVVSNIEAPNAISFPGGCVQAQRTSFTGLTAGQIYDLRVCRTIDGSLICTSPVQWTNTPAPIPPTMVLESIFTLAFTTWWEPHICGKNVRTGTATSANDTVEQLTVRFYQGSTLLAQIQKSSVSADNYTFLRSEIDVNYRGCVSFDDDDSKFPSMLTKGSTYDLEVCRTLNSTQFCSTNRLPWTYAVSPAPGLPGATIGSEPLFLPVVGAVVPKTPTTFVVDPANPPATLAFDIVGINFSSLNTKVFINNVDISTITGVNITVVSAGLISITGYPLSLGGNTSLEFPVEVTNLRGRSNTFFLDIATTPRVRIMWMQEMIIPLDGGAFLFEPWGFDLSRTHKLLDGSGNPIQNGTTNLSWTSSTEPYFLRGSWNATEVEKLTPGIAPIQLETTNGVLSNTIKMRVIGAGQWGTEKLSVVNMHDTTSAGGGVAPTVGQEVTLRLAFTGFDPGGGIGQPGQILFGDKVVASTATATPKTGYAFFTLAAQTFDKAGVVPVVLQNPDGTRSLPNFITVMPNESLRITKISLSSHLFDNAIIRPNTPKAMSVYGQGLASTAKIFLAGRPLKVNSGSATLMTVEFNGFDLPDGVYPVWVENNGQRSNTILVHVYKEGFGPDAASRPLTLIPAIVRKSALTSLGGKIRLGIQGFGFTPQLRVRFSGQTYPVVFVSSSIIGVELDLTSIAAGSYPVVVEDASGTVKSLELELTVE
jgi:hypothetical protein